VTHPSYHALLKPPNVSNRSAHVELRSEWTSVSPCVQVSTVKDSRIVLGGGCPEMIMSRAVEELAAKTPGKRSIAMEAGAYTRPLFSST